MQSTNWARIALNSEIEFSKAFKSKPIEHPTFIHMHNRFVPWGGDFNRAVGVKLSDFRSFEEISGQIESIHRVKGLDRPNRYDIHSPALDEALWQDFLFRHGYSLETAIFFCAPTLKEVLPSDYTLSIPSEQEYMTWFRRLTQRRGFFREPWFRMIQPLQLNFVRVFRPYWLFRDGDLVGWVYCAYLGGYGRLFEVEIDQAFRGQGLGKMLLRAIRLEGATLGARFILLQSGERLRRFYEKAGFTECTRNSIIRLRV